jgi:cysteine desulfurase/selenocysteine lyase
MPAAFRCWSTARRARCILPVDVQRSRLRFLCRHRPQALWPDSGIGALYGKREWLENLPPFLGGGEMIREVTRGPRHLRRSAASVRGRHAADRAGGRAGRGARLYARRRQATRSARTRTPGPIMRMNGCRDQFAAHFRPRAGKGAIVSFEIPKGPCPRRGHGDRPRRRGGAGRHALHAAAADAFRRNRDVPRQSFALYNTRADEVDAWPRR